MRVQFTLLALAVASLPAFASQYSLELKPENTKIQWTLGDVLHTVHGLFTLKSGKIDFDTETGRASGQVVVDVPSGNSDSTMRDRRMHANVLESSKYPLATFTPDRYEGKLAVPGSSELKVHGSFTLHGTPHEMTMTVHTTATGDRMDATVSFDVPYVEWGMKDPSNFLLKVGKTVQFSIESTGPLTKH